MECLGVQFQLEMFLWFAQQLITLVLAFVTRTIFVRKLGAEYTV